MDVLDKLECQKYGIEQEVCQCRDHDKAKPEMVQQCKNFITLCKKTCGACTDVSTCQDEGCSGLWGGHGTCVDLYHNKWSWIESNYNVSVDPKEITDKTLCKPSEKAYKDPNRDCCRCFYSPAPPQCSDNGCKARGGLCVNLLNANLTRANIF